MFTSVSPNVLERARKIRLVLTDVDGVLTEATCYYSPLGEELKKFSLRDGMGIERLREHSGIETGFVTKERTGFSRARAKKLRITEIQTGSDDKGIAIEEIAVRRGLTLDQIAFIGDDINDLPALRKAGLSACPSDSFPPVLGEVHFVCSEPGGRGAFRQLAELILFAQHGRTPGT